MLTGSAKVLKFGKRSHSYPYDLDMQSTANTAFVSYTITDLNEILVTESFARDAAFTAIPVLFGTDTNDAGHF